MFLSVTEHGVHMRPVLDGQIECSVPSVKSEIQFYSSGETRGKGREKVRIECACMSAVRG